MSDLQEIDPSCWIAPTATLSGKIALAENVSVWHNVVMRAECEEITVGRMTNVQDFVMIHVGYGEASRVGEFCSITHHATLHGCTIEDHCLIGINAVVMDGAVIGRGSIVAGGAMVPEGREYPAGSIIAGVPAKVIGERDSARANRLNAWQYHYNAERTRAGDSRAWTGPDYERWFAQKAAEVERDADV